MLSVSCDCCSSPGYVTTEDKQEVDTDTEKRKLLLELLEETDEPVCVYGWFKHDLRVISDCCKILGKRYGEVSGSRKDLTDAGKYPDDVDVPACSANLVARDRPDEGSNRDPAELWSDVSRRL